MITYHLAEFNSEFARVWADGEFGDGSYERFTAWVDGRPSVQAQERTYAMLRAIYAYSANIYKDTKDIRVLNRLNRTAKDCGEAEGALNQFYALQEAGGGELFVGDETVG